MKRAGEVALAFARIQRGLALGLAGFKDPSQWHWNAERAADAPGDESSLVKAPFSERPGRHRHGNEQVWQGHGKGIDPVDDEPGGGAGESQLLAVLKRTQHLVNRLLVAYRRNDPVKRRWPALTSAAQQWPGHWQRTAWAGRVVCRQALPAALAQAVAPFRPIVAEQALRRQHEGQRLEQKFPDHVGALPADRSDRACGGGSQHN